MNGIAQTLEEFGRGIGLAGLRTRHDGRVSLRIGAERRLDIHVQADRVLLMLMRPIAQHGRLATLLRALDDCHLRHGRSLRVSVGQSRAGELVFITQLPEADFRPHTLEQALDLLNRLHDNAIR